MGSATPQWQADDTLSGASVSAMFQVNDGTIWVGTEQGLLGTIIKNKLKLYDAERDIQPRRSPALCRTCRAIRGSRPMVKGSTAFHPGESTNFSNTDGLGDDFTYTIAPDNKGNVWTGSDRGISVCSLRDGQNSFRHHHGRWTSRQHRPRDPSDGEQMWICMQDGGICRMNAVTHAIDIPRR